MSVMPSHSHRMEDIGCCSESKPLTMDDIIQVFKNADEATKTILKEALSITNLEGKVTSLEEKAKVLDSLITIQDSNANEIFNAIPITKTGE